MLNKVASEVSVVMGMGKGDGEEALHEVTLKGTAKS